MKQNKTSLKKDRKEAALASQEQEQILPRVGELGDAELDFVAGGYASLSSVNPMAGPSRSSASGNVSPRHPFSYSR